MVIVKTENYKFFDYEKLYNTLKKLIYGETVLINKFDNEEDRYNDESIEIDPEKTSLVIVEGYFLRNKRFN